MPHLPDKYWVGSTLNITPGGDSEIMHRADHVVKAHEVRAPEYTEQEGTPESTHKPFDSFLRRELDQRCTPDGHAPYICKNIIANDQRGGNPEPYHTLEDIVNDEVTARFPLG